MTSAKLARKKQAFKAFKSFSFVSGDRVPECIGATTCMFLAEYRLLTLLCGTEGNPVDTLLSSLFICPGGNCIFKGYDCFCN